MTSALLMTEIEWQNFEKKASCDNKNKYILLVQNKEKENNVQQSL